MRGPHIGVRWFLKAVKRRTAGETGAAENPIAEGDTEVADGAVHCLYGIGF
jgi:hypothetical protein